jgi:hypothetical protein
MDLETFQIRCFCPIKIDPEKKSLGESFTDIKLWSNIEILKCYRLVFMFEGQNFNIISELVILIFIITIICVILTEIKINKGEIENLINYCKDYININIYENEIKEDTDSFYNCLIKSTKKKESSNYLIENELNELEYDFYRQIEIRKWYQIIWSNFKINCNFLSTFNEFNCYKDFRIYTIKIIIYLNSLVISLVANVFFYHDDTMHKIYEENGKYNIVYKLPYIAISDIVSILATLSFEALIDYQADLIDLKIEMDEQKRKEKAKKIKKSFKRNRIIFYMISIALQLFGLYYLSCFFAIYVNTQIHLLKDFLFGLILSLANLTIRMVLFNVIFKICATKYNSNCFLNCIFKIINSNWFTIPLECLIELLIFIIFKI